MRDKVEFLQLFNWIIARAKHRAYREGRSIEAILNDWETGRNHSWWYAHYKNSSKSTCKLPSGKPRNVKYMSDIVRLKRMHSDKVTRFKLLVSRRQKAAKEARKASGKKPRWSTERKYSERRLREYRKKESVS
jgi:hypothetical protein